MGKVSCPRLEEKKKANCNLRLLDDSSKELSYIKLFKECNPMTNFLNDTRLQGILVVIFIKTNIQSKIMNTTMIPCMSLRKLAIIQFI